MIAQPHIVWLLLLAGLLLLAQCGCAAEPITLEEGAAAQPAAQEEALSHRDLVIIEQCPTLARAQRAHRW